MLNYDLRAAFRGGGQKAPLVKLIHLIHLCPPPLHFGNSQFAVSSHIFSMQHRTCFSLSSLGRCLHTAKRTDTITLCPRLAQFSNQAALVRHSMVRCGAVYTTNMPSGDNTLLAHLSQIYSSCHMAGNFVG